MTGVMRAGKHMSIVEQRAALFCRKHCGAVWSQRGLEVKVSGEPEMNPPKRGATADTESGGHSSLTYMEKTICGSLKNRTDSLSFQTISVIFLFLP